MAAINLIISGAVSDILKGQLPEWTVHGAGFRNHDKTFWTMLSRGLDGIERLVFPVSKERFDYADGPEFLGDDSPERQSGK